MMQTRRLRLRRLRPGDEADLITLDSDPEVMRWVGSPAGVKSPQETAERARQRIGTDHGPMGFWALETRADDRFCGLGALIRMPDGADVELAYRLHRRAWGQGYATEAGAALLDYAFATLALPRVVAVTYPDNRGSQRVLDKLGFTRHGIIDYRGVSVVHFVLRAPGGAP
ncbi:MAG TPA: GNAT family N-acetyltransferase [Methylomirabilota bacterium]|jgi:RimJ/RimL family protein N-acetyltransferase|nr:GNAT family N-acetyltransferase [Methylomirabilota bacterium]